MAVIACMKNFLVVSRMSVAEIVEIDKL
jgi:hypothetical protein